MILQVNQDVSKTFNSNWTFNYMNASCSTVVLDCIRFGLVYCTQNWRKGWNDVSQKRSCEINDCQSVCRVFTNGRSLADGQQYDYGEDLGVTAVALYDYQAGEAEALAPFLSCTKGQKSPL